ncbi:hypothetical protein [Paludisphaera borealis]|uniref:hypothetical protein n=1 Tax=Paludisphaera borealis TaxID=1387353 RepID=UPI0011AB6211|nr:hypothetical protein [Paludisphaera borealis]
MSAPVAGSTTVGDIDGEAVNPVNVAPVDYCALRRFDLAKQQVPPTPGETLTSWRSRYAAFLGNVASCAAPGPAGPGARGAVSFDTLGPQSGLDDARAVLLSQPYGGSYGAYPDYDDSRYRQPVRPKWTPWDEDDVRELENDLELKLDKSHRRDRSHVADLLNDRLPRHTDATVEDLRKALTADYWLNRFVARSLRVMLGCEETVGLLVESVVSRVSERKAMEESRANGFLNNWRAPHSVRLTDLEELDKADWGDRAKYRTLFRYIRAHGLAGCKVRHGGLCLGVYLPPLTDELLAEFKPAFDGDTLPKVPALLHTIARAADELRDGSLLRRVA